MIRPMATTEPTVTFRLLHTLSYRTWEVLLDQKPVGQMEDSGCSVESRYHFIPSDGRLSSEHRTQAQVRRFVMLHHAGK